MKIDIFKNILSSLSEGRIRYYAPSEENNPEIIQTRPLKGKSNKQTALKKRNIPIFTGANFYQDGQGYHIMYPIHTHPSIESIFKISGDVDVFADNQWLIMESEYFYVYLPGAAQGEKYHQKNKPYSLLWVISLPQFTNFHVTTYEPGKGYFLSERLYNIQTPFNSQIWSFSASKTKYLDKCEQNNYQALLMQMFHYLIRNEDILEMNSPNSQHKICQQVKDYIDLYFWQEDLSLQKIAHMFHYSSGHLNVTFRQFFKIPIHQYILKKRLQEAKKQLKSGQDIIIKEIAANVGFRDPLYFSRLFKKHHGKSPQEI